MHTDRTARHGFTLVELLTVIAIIGILAGLTAAGLSQAIHRARMTEMHNRMGNVEDLLYIYYTDHGTFPPGYGYVHPDVRDVKVDCGLDGDPLNDLTPRQDPNCLNPDNQAPPSPDDLPFNHFYLGSYMRELEQVNNKDLYDPWSESYDTDGDGVISYLEFLPFEDRDIGSAVYDDVLYEDGTLAGQNKTDEVNDLLRADQRPFIYIPVNRRQAERVGREYFILADNFGNDDDNLTNDDPRPDDSTFINLVLQDELANALPPPDNQEFSEFPPAKYDAFILMSVGPQNNTAGLIREVTNMVDLNNYPANYRYHVMGHILYFMLTRDADDNAKYDFTYDDRRDLSRTDRLFALPDQNLRNAPGPVVVVSSR